MKKGLFVTIRFTFGNVAYLFAQWVISVLIVRVSGFADQGLFSLAMTIANIFYMVASYGLRTFQVSDVSGVYSSAAYITARYMTMLVALVGCFLYAIFRGYPADMIGIIMLYMLYKSVEAFSDVLYGELQRHDRLDAVGLSLFIKGAMNIIAFAVPYLLFRNMALALACMFVSSAIVLFFYDIAVTRKCVPVGNAFGKETITGVRRLLMEGAWMMAFVFAVPLMNAIPRLSLESRLSIEALGVFTTISMPTVLVSTLVSCVLLPLVPKASFLFEKGRKGDLLRHMSGIVVAIVILGFLSCVLAFFWGAPFLDLLFGNDASSWLGLLFLMIVSITITSIMYALGNFLVAIRKIRGLVVISALSCAVEFAISDRLVAGLGLDGGAYTLIISQSVMVIIATGYLLYCVLHKGATGHPLCE